VDWDRLVDRYAIANEQVHIAEWFSDVAMVRRKSQRSASDVITELAHCVLDIDARACNKFGLPAATTPPAPRMCNALGT
jgi:hypothetical protein